MRDSADGDSVSAQVDDELVSRGSLSLSGMRDDSNRIVTARGTEDGLTIRIDGRAEWEEVLSELHLFLGDRRRFLEGCEVSVEWLERLPLKEQSKELEQLLQERYGIQVIGRRRRRAKVDLASPSGAASPVVKSMTGSTEQIVSLGSELVEEVSPGKASTDTRPVGATIPLFDLENQFPGVSAATSRAATQAATQVGGVRPGVSRSVGERGREGSSNPPFSGFGSSARRSSQAVSGRGGAQSRSGDENTATSYDQMLKMLGDELLYDEEANAKVVFGTLRSGQRVETPFSLIVVGDVNPGADLVAGGDIIVLGNLRGTAHASAYDDESADRVILALQMQPMQLRIGSVISRGSDEAVKGAEIARIEDRRIVVESYNPKIFSGKLLAQRKRRDFF